MRRNAQVRNDDLAAGVGLIRETDPFFYPDMVPRPQYPLRGDDPDATLDLQEVFAAAYDRGAYDLEVDYRSPPNPPLTAPNAEWPGNVLRKGFAG